MSRRRSDIWFKQRFWDTAAPDEILSRLAAEEIITVNEYHNEEFMEIAESFTPFHWALQADETDERIVAELLKNGVNPNARDRNGMTPLHMAALYGETNIVNLLLAAGARVQIRSKDGRSVLHGASYKTAREIIKAGADIEARETELGATPLLWAALDDEISQEKIHILIEEGAKINAQDSEGNKLWQYASLSDDNQKYQKLIQCILFASASKIEKDDNEKPTLKFESASIIPNDSIKIDKTNLASSFAPLVTQIASNNFVESNILKLHGNISDLTRVPGTDFVTGVVREQTGQIKEFVPLEVVSPSLVPATLATGFLVLSRLVGQAHMAEINKSLLDIRSSIDKINFFQENQRKSSILGSLKYIQQINEFDECSEIEKQSILNQVESHESKLNDIQTHLSLDIENISLAISGGGLDEGTFKEYLEQFSSLYSQSVLVLIIRSFGLSVKEKISQQTRISKIRSDEIKQSAHALTSQFAECCCDIIDNLQNVSLSFWGPTQEEFENEIIDALMETVVNYRTSLKDFGGDLYYDRKEPEIYIELNGSGDQIKNLYIAQ